MFDLIARQGQQARSLLSAACSALIAALVGLAMPSPASADYPEKLVRLVVPQAPGSATDVLARMLASEMEPLLRQTVLVENKAGGALTTGLSFVAKSAPDGYTIGMGPIGALAITRHLVKDLPYDVERDFQPIALVARGEMILAVSPKLNVHSVKELIAYAKEHPDKLVYASSSTGAPGHVGAELFKAMAGISMPHVPYRGGSSAITDLISGQVHVMLESMNSISPFAKSGEVRALGVSGRVRSQTFPDLPTIDEAGVPGFEVTTWSGVVGPAGLPQPVVGKLNAVINQAIGSKSFTERLGVLGQETAGGSPQDFADVIRKDSIKWLEVIRKAGVRLE